WMAGHRIRSPDKCLGGMPPRHLSSHQPQAIKNENSPFEWIQKGGHVIHDPYSNQRKRNGIIENRSAPRGFSIPPGLKDWEKPQTINTDKASKFVNLKRKINSPI
ncbi:hypothetical protein, partial [Gluconobacter kondonii]|uniref:hypothetical protein n=1 Tax=Gluconobacter kondonii TaxID=941463 RepID=UPI001B8D2246